MQQGRPIEFRQPDPDTPADEVPAEAPVDMPVAVRPDRLKSALTFASNWSSTPATPNQAKLYPDTVKNVDVRYRTFDVTSSNDMDLYSKIVLSNEEGGQYYFSSAELLNWCPLKSTTFLTVRVTERAFKSIHTSTTNPTQP